MAQRRRDGNLKTAVADSDVLRRSASRAQPDRVSDRVRQMAKADIAQTGLAQAAARFPAAAARLRRLALADPGFRELCEEYGLARQSLARFEARPDAAERPEVTDYRSVIAELEGEIDRSLREARPGG